MLGVLFDYPNLDILEASVEDLTFQENSLNGIPVISGVMLASGQILATKKVVITTGTFLSGEIHIGQCLFKISPEQYPTSTRISPPPRVRTP